MGSVAERISSALAPYVGATVADTCVRATALSIGKTWDTLDIDDIPALETNVRRLLAPVAPGETISRVLAEIEGGAA